MTNASDTGTFLMIRKLDHENVPMTTTNITPVSAAIGMISIRGDATSMYIRRNIAASAPERRHLAPDFMLIML